MTIETIFYALPSNPSTGYQWFANAVDDFGAPSIAIVIDSSYIKKDPTNFMLDQPLIGGGGYTMFEIKCDYSLIPHLYPHHVTFLYKTPWTNSLHRKHHLTINIPI